MAKNCCKQFSKCENNGVIYIEVKAKDLAEKNLYYLHYMRIHKPGKEFTDYEKLNYCPFCGEKLE